MTMKTARIIVSVFLVIAFQGISLSAEEAKTVPFERGEQLVFDVYLSVLKVGLATMTIRDIVDINGRRAYHIVLENRTTKSYSKVFKVDDRFETFLDTETLAPLKFVRKLEEGNYSCSETTAFDHKKLEAHFESHSKKRKLSFPIKPGTQDTLSIFYLMRTMKIELGKPLIFDMMSDEKVYKLSMKPLRRTRTPIYRGDTYNTIQFIPRAEFNGDLFTKGRGWLWLSDDERKLPVLFRASLPFGSITFALVKIQNIYQEKPAGDHSDGSDTET